MYLNPNMVTHQIGSSVGDKATNLEREDPSLKFIVGYFLPYFLCTLSSFEGASGLEVELEMLKFRERLHDLLYSAPVGQQIDANIDLFLETYTNLIVSSLTIAKLKSKSRIKIEETYRACNGLVSLISPTDSNGKLPVYKYLEGLDSKDKEKTRRKEFKQFTEEKGEWKDIGKVTKKFLYNSKHDIGMALKGIFCLDERCRENNAATHPWGAMVVSILSPIREDIGLAVEPLDDRWKEYIKKEGTTGYHAIQLLTLYVIKMARLDAINFITEGRYRRSLIKAYESVLFTGRRGRKRTLEEKVYCDFNILGKHYFLRYVNELNDYAFRIAQGSKREGEQFSAEEYTALAQLREAGRYMNEVLSVELDCLMVKLEEIERKRKILETKMAFVDTKLAVTIMEFWVSSIDDDDDEAREEWLEELKTLKREANVTYKMFRALVRKQTEKRSEDGPIVAALQGSKNSHYLEQVESKLAALSRIIRELKARGQ